MCIRHGADTLSTLAMGEHLKLSNHMEMNGGMISHRYLWTHNDVRRLSLSPRSPTKWSASVAYLSSSPHPRVVVMHQSGMSVTLNMAAISMTGLFKTPAAYVEGNCALSIDTRFIQIGNETTWTKSVRETLTRGEPLITNHVAIFIKQQSCTRLYVARTNEAAMGASNNCTFRCRRDNLLG